MLINELSPIYDGRRSFYHKARVFVYPTAWVDLESYTTTVCRFDREEGTFEFYGDYSATTRRHTWEFLLQMTDEYWTSKETWLNACEEICKNEKIHSLAKFLQKVRKVDLREHTYTLRNGETFKY